MLLQIEEENNALRELQNASREFYDQLWHEINADTGKVHLQDLFLNNIWRSFYDFLRVKKNKIDRRPFVIGN